MAIWLRNNAKFGLSHKNTLTYETKLFVQSEFISAPWYGPMMSESLLLRGLIDQGSRTVKMKTGGQVFCSEGTGKRRNTARRGTSANRIVLHLFWIGWHKVITITWIWRCLYKQLSWGLPVLSLRSLTMISVDKFSSLRLGAIVRSTCRRRKVQDPCRLSQFYFRSKILPRSYHPR